MWHSGASPLWAGFRMLIFPDFLTLAFLPFLPMLSPQMLSLIFSIKCPSAHTFPFGINEAQPLRVFCKFCHLLPQLDINTISVCSGSCCVCKEERTSSHARSGWRGGVSWSILISVCPLYQQGGCVQALSLPENKHILPL